MKMYKVLFTMNRIDTIEVERETESFVYINDMRFAKVTDYYAILPTFEKSRECMKDRIMGKIESLEDRIKSCKADLFVINGLTEIK